MIESAKLSAKEARLAFAQECLRGLFRAGIRINPPSESFIIVYPTKAGAGGFVWLRWEDFVLENVEAGIQHGGREPSASEAIRASVADLLASFTTDEGGNLVRKQ